MSKLVLEKRRIAAGAIAESKRVAKEQKFASFDDWLKSKDGFSGVPTMTGHGVDVEWHGEWKGAAE